LITVDWLFSSCRAMTSVTSELFVAELLDRVEVTESEQPLALDPSGWESSAEPGSPGEVAELWR